MPKHLDKPPRTPFPPLNRWLEDVHSFVLSLVPIQSLNTRTTRSAIGTSIESQAASAPANSGMVFRGVWDPTFAYAIQDVVVIAQAGIYGGTYVCVRAAPVGTPAPNFPELGDYWFNISPGIILGAWA